MEMDTIFYQKKVYEVVNFFWQKSSSLDPGTETSFL